MPEYGPVYLNHHTRLNFDDEIRSDSQNVAVVRSMVNFAERQPVRKHRVAEWVRIGQDVRRVKQVDVAEPTHGACPVKGAKHTSSKQRLV